MKKNLNPLILAIYDTVTEPQKMHSLLDTVCEQYNFKGANIFCSDDVNQEITTVWNSQLIHDAFPDYVENGYMKIEQPMIALTPKVAPKQSLATESTFLKKMINEHQLSISQIAKVHQWLKEKYGIEQRIAATLNITPGYWDYLTLHLGEEQFSGDNIIETEASLLLPHLAKALMLNRPFTLLRQRYNAILEVLDKFLLGVFIIDKQCQSILSNDSGQGILEAADGVSMSSSGQIKLGLNQQTELQKHLHDVAQNSSLVKSFTIERKSNKTSYVAQLSSMSSTLLNEQGDYYLLIITDPENTAIIDLSGMEKIFQLSRAETEITQLIIEGLSNSEIADSRNTSVETVKSQVKSIMSKTDCNSRLALVNQAHKTTIPLK